VKKKMKKRYAWGGRGSGEKFNRPKAKTISYESTLEGAFSRTSQDFKGGCCKKGKGARDQNMR